MHNSDESTFIVHEFFKAILQMLQDASPGSASSLTGTRGSEDNQQDARLADPLQAKGRFEARRCSSIALLLRCMYVEYAIHLLKSVCNSTSPILGEHPRLL